MESTYSMHQFLQEPIKKKVVLPPYLSFLINEGINLNKKYVINEGSLSIDKNFNKINKKNITN